MPPRKAAIAALRQRRDTLDQDVADYTAVAHGIRRFPDEVLQRVLAWAIHCTGNPETISGPYLWREPDWTDHTHSPWKPVPRFLRVEKIPPALPWTVATVSRKWRRCALDNTALWSTFIIERAYAGQVEAIQTQLAYAREAALKIHINFHLNYSLDLTQPAWKGVLEALMTHRNQWASFHVVLPSQASMAPFGALAREIALDLSSPPLIQFGIVLPTQVGALELVAPLSDTTCLTHLNVAWNEPTILLAVLREAPNLVVCALHIMLLWDPTPIPQPPTSHVLPRLRRLSIVAESSVTDILGTLTTPALEYLFIDAPMEGFSSLLERSQCALQGLCTSPAVSSSDVASIIPSCTTLLHLDVDIATQDLFDLLVVSHTMHQFPTHCPKLAKIQVRIQPQDERALYNMAKFRWRNGQGALRSLYFVAKNAERTVGTGLRGWGQLVKEGCDVRFRTPIEPPDWAVRIEERRQHEARSAKKTSRRYWQPEDSEHELELAPPAWPRILDMQIP
uniref:F-box domain-containing protein n=1 Tax=Mycena chlorophos TaxID=658473 RepID=A0ABQ0L154_MYCCL|nr:predicted protein [Mycena chlorophos]